MCIPTKEQISLSTSFVESFAGVDMGTRVQPGNTHVFSCQGIGMLIESHLRSLVGVDMGPAVQPGNTYVHSGQGIDMAY